MATVSTISDVFPLGSRLNELGRLEVGGCDTIELAREFGTPAYVVAEDDLRARARAYRQAGADAGWADLQVAFASKAFPCTAVLRLFAEEGLHCDVASAGELHLALAAGFEPSRIVMHGNAKSIAELQMALRARVGLIVIDNFDEIERLRGLTEPAAGGGASVDVPQQVLLRVTPDVRGRTHEKISTGQADSKFGFSVADVPEAARRVRGIAGLGLQGIHVHIGSQLTELQPFRRAVAEVAGLASMIGGECATWDLGGGLGVRYLQAQPAPPSIEDYVGALLGAVREATPPPAPGRSSSNEGGSVSIPRRLLIEPGRSLSANGCVTLYTVESVKRNVSTWVAVDGGMSDNLRPMLYGARYEAHIADRLDGSAECVLAGKHCESGDVIVADALLDAPREGDIVVTPATGAYGYAMSNNYNGVLRAPVVFCREGDARLVVRRDAFEDLSARDVG